LGGGELLGRFERARAVIEILAPSSEVRLATSGSGLTPERARQLAASGLKVLAISLDSHERERVDMQRGRGAFDTAVKALRASADAPFDTLVTAVVSRTSLAREGATTALLELVSRCNPRAVVNFLPEFATGRSDEGFATPDEYAQHARALERSVREGRYRAAVFYNSAMEQFVGCVGAGQRQLVIDTRANLSACVSGASFSNLLEEPFERVWSRMLAAPSRLKRGYFCAHVHQGDEPLPTDEATMLRALRAFHEEHGDALLQRVIDLALRATGGSTARVRTE
jgi:MoaA/NifB/PqqE/SkfB family radical SAM enzyme